MLNEGWEAIASGSKQGGGGRSQLLRAFADAVGPGGSASDTDKRVVRCFPRAGPSLYDVPDGAEVRVARFAEKRTDTFVVIEQERILPGRCRFTHEIRCGGYGRNGKWKKNGKCCVAVHAAVSSWGGRVFSLSL